MGEIEKGLQSWSEREEGYIVFCYEPGTFKARYELFGTAWEARERVGRALTRLEACVGLIYAD